MSSSCRKPLRDYQILFEYFVLSWCAFFDRSSHCLLRWKLDGCIFATLGGLALQILDRRRLDSGLGILTKHLLPIIRLEHRTTKSTDIGEHFDPLPVDVQIKLCLDCLMDPSNIVTLLDVQFVLLPQLKGLNVLIPVVIRCNLWKSLLALVFGEQGLDNRILELIFQIRAAVDVW